MKAPLSPSFAEASAGSLILSERSAQNSLRLCCYVLSALMFVFSARSALVYETAGEFLTAGDFNGDGIPDVLVLDKATGNARVGYLDTNSGILAWSAALPTGVENVTGCAIGRFITNSLDSLAVTSPDFNHIILAGLGSTNNTGPVLVLTPPGIGPHTLVTLSNPLGGIPPNYNSLLAASANNSMPAEEFDLLSINAGAGAPVGQYGEIGSFERGNSVVLAAGGASFATGLVRGTNDLFHLWQFTNAPAAILFQSNLPPGSDYAFGLFNNESLPRFAFYVSGQSNLILESLISSNNVLAFSQPVTNSFGQALEHVFFSGAGGGSFLLQFANDIQAVSFPGGSPVLGAPYQSGVATGNVFTGMVPLSNGLLALLDAPSGATSSAHSQLIRFDGTNYSALSATNLPTVTSRNTRANVWLFQTDPFTNSAAVFVGSASAPDWSDAGSGLPGSLSVLAEPDTGLPNGLGTAIKTNLAAPPSGSAIAVVNAYHPLISIFNYSGPRAAEPVLINISPPPGIYGGPISVSFSSSNVTDHVLYNTGSTNLWHIYAAPFTLSNDATIQFYGTNSSGARSRLQFAAYSLGHSGTPPAGPFNLSGNTNAIAPGNTNTITLSPKGTLFYGRRSAANVGTIWAVNLDGTGDAYITTGARPRVSRDGRFLAFLREGNPFNNQGNIWMRDLVTGTETRLFVNPDSVIGFDWFPDNSGLLSDYGCWIFRVGTNGVTSGPLTTYDCYDDAPVLNPVNGSFAFHNVNPSSGYQVAGLYVAAPDGSGVTRLVQSTSSGYPVWPAWSHDGAQLSFSTTGNAMNLYVINSNGLGLAQITAFANTNNGFPQGALWSPANDALIGAGSINGTNGLWSVPLTPEHTACAAPPLLIATSPGDPIDFAGSIVVAPAVSAPQPGLFIRLTVDKVIVFWSTNYTGFTLESSSGLSVPIAWSAVNGPVYLSGPFFEYAESRNSLQAAKFFRLHLTGAMFLAPQPTLTISVETTVVLSWPTNYAAFTLEAAYDLPPNGSWIAVPGPYPLSGQRFQYTEPASSHRYYRLRWP